MAVVLPAPFSPTSPSTRPASMSIETPSLATTSPKRFVTSTSRAAMPGRSAVKAGNRPAPGWATGMVASAGDRPIDTFDQPVRPVDVVDGERATLGHNLLTLVRQQRARPVVELAID